MLLEKLEGRRRELIAEVDRLTAEQLVFRPTPRSWSTLDVVEHLVKVEEGIASRIRPREPRSLAQTARVKASLGAMYLLAIAGRRIKVPVEAILPLGGATLSDLVARWDDARDALGARLEALAPGDYARPMMRHPLLGLLTPAEGLAFLHWHMGHHRRQLGRIRRASGYPRS
jgi:uncharacterized damage-inducible protein DinB